MPKATPKRDLVIIGTARKPNASDLRNRGLTGLPDPSSDVTRRRAELEAEQAALRAGWDFLEKERELSFLRTVTKKRNGGGGGIDGKNLDGKEEVGEGTKGGDEGVKVSVEEQEEAAMGGADTPKPTVRGDSLDQTESPVANNEPGRPQQARRDLRKRNPVQQHPYAVERETYRRAVKVGKAN